MLLSWVSVLTVSSLYTGSSASHVCGVNNQTCSLGCCDDGCCQLPKEVISLSLFGVALFAFVTSMCCICCRKREVPEPIYDEVASLEEPPAPSYAFLPDTPRDIDAWSDMMATSPHRRVDPLQILENLRNNHPFSPRDSLEMIPYRV